jgi:hypothetical protein
LTSSDRHPEPEHLPAAHGYSDAKRQKKALAMRYRSGILPILILTLGSLVSSGVPAAAI